MFSPISGINMSVVPTGVVEIVSSGSLLLAIPLAMLAGVISFLSPCVLPLVPGYLSYAAGIAGARANAKRTSITKSRAFWGTLLFVIGFSIVFVSFGALFGAAGQFFIEQQKIIQTLSGVIIIILGLGFLGLIPALNREVRVHRIPTGTLAGALIMGITFGIGWTPCMALTEASAGRGAILSAAFSLGLGLPFIFIGLMLERGVKAVALLRSHSKGIMHFGGVLLIAIGLLLVTGYWNELTITLRVWASNWDGWLL
jgi:cytochrome c-type biogenesis protein